MEAVNKEALFEIGKYFRNSLTNSPWDYFANVTK
jgi:hypothetical protein